MVVMVISYEQHGENIQQPQLAQAEKQKCHRRGGEVESFHIEPLGVVCNGGRDDQRSKRMKRCGKTFQSEGKTQPDQTLLRVVNLTTDNVMLQVQLSAEPGISVQFCHPNDEKHDVLHPSVLLEVHIMDKVVLQLVEETCKDTNGNDA